MGRISPSRTLCRFSLDLTHHRLSRCGVRRSWDASHQRTKRQNGDLSSLCEGTESSSLRLSCILSFFSCVFVFYSICCLAFDWVLLRTTAEREPADVLCSRTIILRDSLSRLGVTPVNPATRRESCRRLFCLLVSLYFSQLDPHVLLSLEQVHRLSLQL